MPIVEHLETPTDDSAEELADVARLGSREAWIDGQGMAPVEVYDADRLHAGASIAGPAIMQSPTTTILLGPGDELTVGSDDSLDLHVTLVQPAAVR
jgi:N-methylhydantoinase A/oxoprolinase/acetone carboxylase beta subunit